ncbi:hypothetical protein O2W14_06195 [Modestobacter sp. VKM Ac-2986]|uniref:hypothetical protein n=1 Tax=Modestobacter sp. VKM Ac-2986 TaxID=3004140 RepID=UPI0022A9FC55|nr:hypothetical protein [Modestobacter sp. VKM Ac-2986]MCZ2828425.1 hypothetical protein [Modestobacter sp. VKM Ac-2986]
MPDMKEPSPEAHANVTQHNVDTRAELYPEERSTGGSVDPEKQAELILAESEERTIHPDADDANGGHRQSAETADLP